MKKYVLMSLLLASPACITDLSVEPPQGSNTCDPEGYELMLEVFPTCDLGMCGELPEHQARGRCVDDNQLDAAQLAILAPCGNSETPQHCVPAKLLASDGRSKPQVCRSLLDAEGRCMSLCVPQIQAKKDQLPVDVCDEGELCAPCYDPFTGESSGACDASVCDAPEEVPVLFPTCCEGKGGGNCVPRELVPDDSEESLGEDVCTETATDDVCVPTGFDDPNYAPPVCENALGIEGRCLPTCVPQVDSVGGLFLQNNCPETFQRCVPCWANGQFCD